MGACLEVRGGRRRFGDVQALEHATLDVEPGTWVGLVGPNGAGKTTLLRTLCGLERLDAGTVRVLEGEAGLALTAADRQQVGIVPQDIALYPLLTPRENLEVFGRLNGLRGAVLAERVAWALDWTGLATRARDRVQTFSGGMKRRVNIACSVLHRPRILLLDEPTVGVDLAGRDRIRTMLRSLCDEGTALLQSSHQLDELQAVCDRIVVMLAGRTLATLSADALAEAGLGSARTVRLALARSAAHLTLPAGLEAHDRTIEGTIRDVSRDLASLLRQLEAEGIGVHAVRVEAPSLEDVFGRLTGWRRPA